MESELSGICRVKIVTKNMVRGSPGTQFMHMRVKAKGSEILSTPSCLGNILKGCLVDSMKKTGSNGYFYDFSFDYDAIAIDEILDIHKYLRKNNNIIQKCLDLLKKYLF